jgi:hypothetical protein
MSQFVIASSWAGGEEMSAYRSHGYDAPWGGRHAIGDLDEHDGMYLDAYL